MPWCEDCAKFWNPNSVPADGTCPTCHRPLGAPASTATTTRRPAAETDGEADTERTKVPWHFWVMVACVALYLGWRVVQLVAWLVQGALG